MNNTEFQEEKLPNSHMDILKDAALCTTCGWCLDWCPAELDIPLFMAVSGELCFAPAAQVRQSIDALEESKRPTACLTCWKCARMCPQNIPIPKVIRELNGMLQEENEVW